MRGGGVVLAALVLSLSTVPAFAEEASSGIESVSGGGAVPVAESVSDPMATEEAEPTDDGAADAANSEAVPYALVEAVLFTPVSMTAYTGGEAMGHEAFPTVRWNVSIGEHNAAYLMQSDHFVRISFYSVDIDTNTIVGKFSLSREELLAAYHDPDTTFVIPELGASFYNVGDDAIDLEWLFQEISKYDSPEDVPEELMNQYLTLMRAIMDGPVANDGEPGNYLIGPGATYGLLFGGSLGGSDYSVRGLLEAEDFGLNVGDQFEYDSSGAGVENKQAWSVGFGVNPTGYLVTRYVTDPSRVLSGELDIATPVTYGSATTLARAVVPAAGASAFSAVIPNGSVIETNDNPALGVLGTVVDGGLVTEVEGGQNPQISLLADDLLPTDEGGSREGAVQARAEQWLTENGQSLDRRHYQFKYLDLVNENDGNAWVSSSLGADVTWPYPEGTDASTEFTLLQLPGMFREYGINGEAEIEQALAAAEPVEQTIENTADGIRFHVDTNGYGPFVLTWQTAGETTEPEGPAEPVTPETPETTTDSDQAPLQGTGSLPATGDVSMTAVPMTAALGVIVAGVARVSRRGKR